jgi:hypothetical protein
MKDQCYAAANGRAWCVVAPVAPPRLWHMITRAAGLSFGATLGDARNGEADLQRAIGAAAQAISRVQSVLVEPHLALDAQLAAFVHLGDVALITVCSGMRVYRARGSEPTRLLANAHRAPGIARGGLAVATERIVHNDLYVLGSRDAFGMRSIGALASLLARRPDASVTEVSEAALRPCRDAGIGASLVVLRAR